MVLLLALVLLLPELAQFCCRATGHFSCPFFAFLPSFFTFPPFYGHFHRHQSSVRFIVCIQYSLVKLVVIVTFLTIICIIFCYLSAVICMILQRIQVVERWEVK